MVTVRNTAKLSGKKSVLIHYIHKLRIGEIFLNFMRLLLVSIWAGNCRVLLSWDVVQKRRGAGSGQASHLALGSPHSLGREEAQGGLGKALQSWTSQTLHACEQPRKYRIRACEDGRWHSAHSAHLTSYYSMGPHFGQQDCNAGAPV